METSIPVTKLETRADSTPWTSSRWFVPALLGLIMVVAVVVRFYDIGGESIWWDEGFSHRWATMPWREVIRETSHEDYNPPLYYLMLNGWVHLFGDSEASMRVPSAISSAVAVFLTYLIARQLTSRNVGLFAAGAMAVSSYQIVYAQQARAYGLLMMCVLGSMYCFLRLMRDWKPLLLAIYVLSTAAMFYTHVYGVFFFGVQGLALLAIWIRRAPTQFTIKRTIVVSLVLLVMLIPWIMFAISRGEAAETSFWIEFPTAKVVAGAFERLAGSIPLVTALGLLCLLAACVLIFSIRKLPQPSEAVDPINGFTKLGSLTFLFTWFILPHAVPLLVSYALHPIYYHRYTIPMAPAMYILAGIGLMALRPQPVRIVVCLLVFGLMGSELFHELTKSDNTVAADLARYVDATAKPGDMLVFDGHSGGGQNTFDYYSRRTDVSKHMIAWPFEAIDERYIAELKACAKDHDGVWLITIASTNKDAKLEKWMKDEFPYIKRWTQPRPVQMYAVHFSRTPLP